MNNINFYDVDLPLVLGFIKDDHPEASFRLKKDPLKVIFSAEGVSVECMHGDSEFEIEDAAYYISDKLRALKKAKIDVLDPFAEEANIADIRLGILAAEDFVGCGLCRSKPDIAADHIKSLLNIIKFYQGLG